MGTRLPLVEALPLPLPLLIIILIYKLDLDIVSVYLHAENEVSGLRLSDVRAQTRQTCIISCIRSR